MVTIDPVSGADLMLEIDPGGLKKGINILHMQVFDQDSLFSAPVSGFFFNKAAAENLAIGYRYWFNNQVDQAVDIPVSPQAGLDILLSVAPENLSYGVNVVHFQAYDDAGLLSAPVQGFFFNQPATADLISGYRYWFNNQAEEAVDVSITPGQFVDFTGAIDASSLVDGLNTLHLAFYSDLNNLISPYSHYFYKRSGSYAEPRIKACQYWFDDNFAKALTEEVELAASSYVTAAISTDSICKGVHRFNIRFKDENDVWTQTTSSIFFKPSDKTADIQAITAYEYWLDDGNRTTVELDTLINPMDLGLTLDLTAEEIASHQFHFRSRDAYGQWSVVSSHEFYRDSVHFFEADMPQLCDSGMVYFFNYVDTSQYTYEWRFEDGSLSTEFEPMRFYHAKGCYPVNLRITDRVTLQDTSETRFVTVGSSFMQIDALWTELGDSVEWRGQYYKEEGVYHEFFTTELGCDSIYVMELTLTDSLLSAPKDILLTPDTIRENAPPGTLVGYLSALDYDMYDAHQFRLVAGDSTAHNAFFEIVDTALYTKASFDFELQNSYVILVEAEDKQGYTLQEFVEIWVMDVNETPLALNLSDTLVYEDAPVGSYVGSFDATDPDYFDNFSFRLVAGEGDIDNAKFRIDGNDLYTKTLLDFEKRGELSIRVEVTDQGNASLTQVFKISVLDVNEAPTAISLSNHKILENEAAGTLIGRFNTADPDAGNSFNYLFAMGENDIDNDSFNIRGDSLITDAVFDFEKKSTYFIRVMAVDQDGAVFERSFTIVIEDVDENPKAITDIRLSKHEVPENDTVPVFVGKLSTVGGIPAFNYDFVIGDGDYDNDRFMISNDTLYALVSFDFENRSLYFVRIQTTDIMGESMSKLMLILAEDVNESPYALNLFNNVIDEQQPAYSLVSKIISFDQDKGDTHNYSLVEGEGDTDNAHFIIRGDSLLTADVLYFDQKPAYSIRLQTTDLGGMSYSTNTTVILNKLSGLGQNTSNALNALLGENELIVHAFEFGGKRIVLHNLLGQLVLSEELHSPMSNFKLNSLPRGVYLLSIYDKDVLIQKIKISRN